MATIKIPSDKTVGKVKLLVSGEEPKYDISNGALKLNIDPILDHEVIALDFV
jgi:hypothetical protein